jgi:hypothetical protein
MSQSSETSSRERTDAAQPDRPQRAGRKPPAQPAVPEIGGPKGPEPTRYGDWEKGGRCSDF